MIEVVLWDFGGVFTGSPFANVGVYATQIGASADELLDLVFGYGDDGDHPWHRVERGEIALAEAVAQIVADVRAAGLDAFDPGGFFGSLRGDTVESRDHVVQKVRDLSAAGLRHGIITNNIAEFSSGWRSLIPVEELFEVVIDSSAVGVRKPDPAIYHLALDHLGGVAPSAAVFLDDYLGNVEAARALGMHAIHVGPDPGPALDELEALLSSP